MGHLWENVTVILSVPLGVEIPERILQYFFLGGGGVRRHHSDTFVMDKHKFSKMDRT